MDYSRTFPLTLVAGRLRALLVDHLAVARIILGEQGEGLEYECETVSVVEVYETRESHRERWA